MRKLDLAGGPQEKTTPSVALAATKFIVQVPFIGCKADGMVGPEHAPMDTGGAPFVQDSVAPHLAYYAASNAFGILAPRRWYCFDYYGSSGAFIVVSPDPSTGRDSISSLPGILPGMTGPAIHTKGHSQ